jgi:hypothetical protein
VLFDQPRHPQLAASFAPAARDLQHRDPVSDIGEVLG